MFRRARGFAMPVVIAIVVVFATIMGTALVTISSAQHVGFGLDLQGVRAYYAARAGLEWGMYHVLRPGFGGCAGIDNKSVVFGGNLAGFRATLRCFPSLHQEGGATVNMYAITATACNAGACLPANPPAGYVERQLRASVAK
jgi:MSHA biogenesis protein MshP